VLRVAYGELVTPKRRIGQRKVDVCLLGEGTLVDLIDLGVVSCHQAYNGAALGEIFGFTRPDEDGSIPPPEFGVRHDAVSVTDD
jgi:hypothetical protein